MDILLPQPAINGTTPQPSLALTPLTPATSETDASKASSAKTPQGFTWHETLLGTASIVFWIVLIDFGYLVKSGDYRYDISQMHRYGFAHVMESLVMLLLSFSVSNVALICCVCGFLGAMADRSDIDGDTHDSGGWSNLWQKYASAVLRGFFVFLALMSGMILISGSDLSVTTPQTYGHLAGTASLFSFLIGWDAHLFTKFVQKVYDKGMTEAQQSAGVVKQEVEKRSLDTAPDGSTHKEITHTVASGSMNSANILSNIPTPDALQKPADVGERAQP